MISKKLLVMLVALMLGSAALWAQQTVTVVPGVNGTVEVDNDTPAAGDIVTITVTPAPGYQVTKEDVVAEVTIDPGSANAPLRPKDISVGEFLELTGDTPSDPTQAATYTFEMPASPLNVRVRATFTEAAAPVPPLYVIGDFGHGWTPNDGVEFNYDAENEQYTLDVTASGTAYFSIATALAESGDDWAFINSHRLGGAANVNQNFIITAKNHDNIALVAFDETTDGAGKSFQIAAGTYTIVVSSDFSTMQVLGDFPAEKYFLIGSYNSWSQDTKREMTLENGKYVITQAMDANAEFKLVNEANTVWYGAQSEGNFVVTEEQVTQGTEITILMGGGNNLQIPVAGEWTFTFDDETMKLVISGEWVTPTTLAEILAADPVDENVVVANDLAVVDILADQHIAFATDGDGNWVELSMDNDVLDFIEATPTLAGGSIKGLFIHDSFNPTIVIEEMPEAAQEAMQIEPAVYPVNLDFAPKPCEVFYVTGYYHSTGGTNNGANLREWSGNGGQMGVLLDLDLSWTATGNMEDGKHYKIRGTALLKEAWDDPAPDGIRPMVSHDDPMALRNYTIMATEIPNTPTAIDHLTQNVGVKSVRYYNLQGVELSAPAEGLNILVIEHADGTTTTQKILK